MKIELKKQEDVLGDTWYQIYVDGYAKKTFKGMDAEYEANLCFDQCKERAENGYPKEEVVRIFKA